jgi:hypothetical protein
MLQGRGGFGFLLALAILMGRPEADVMSGDPEGPPTLSLQRPGLVTTSQVQPFKLNQIFSYYLGVGRRLHTVKSFRGGNSEARGFRSFDPVDWETTVPPGAQLFSVTAGISPDTTQQFWVGWLAGREVYMEALTEQQAISTPLTAGETLVFPGIMDAAGAASLFSWRAASEGAKLVQRRFSGTKVTETIVADIPGHPVVSRVAAVPGAPSLAVVGWAEGSEVTRSSVLGFAVVEGGQARVWRSQEISLTSPLAAQRLGVWAASADHAEVAAVLVAQWHTPAYHRLARFGSTIGPAPGAPTSVPLDLPPGHLVSAAIDYAASPGNPHSAEYYLLKNGAVLNGGMIAVARDVPPDSPLPLIDDYWVGRNADGSPSFERPILE